ncbi:HD family hydrolase [Lujinxingia vulgaris]|uniref:5'-deoxynucleotidase n=1 Tax=Lujinxingia vulgaris TaxID=2600176 RepID=A0A5C6XMX1_9DELT|nr:HD family hydrolase [Lujinxingia vulgaris]TXD38952.1 HD family hydrolase [Lujinxingia vulgaris]
MNDQRPAPGNANDLLRLLSRAERLEALPRTGWQICGVERPESIAAHVHGVMLVALWLADHHPEPTPDAERVMRIALVHDLSEAMLTDLPRPVKQLLGKEAVDRAEEQAADHILATLPSWRDAYREYREGKTLEARIVKVADRIQMLAKALEYRQQKRGDISRFFDDDETFDDRGVEPARAIFDALRTCYREGRWFDFHFD